MAIPEFYFDGFGWVYRDWLGRRHELPSAQDPEEAKEAAAGLPIWETERVQG